MSKLKVKIFFLIYLFLCLPHCLCSGANWLLKEETISPDLDAFDCHSSAIIETSGGKFCAVWKGGPGTGRCNIDLKENVGLWISYFEGSNWSEPQKIVSASDSVCWTPVLCKNSLGELLLFYRIGATPRNTVSFVKVSHSDGKEWSHERILPAGIVGPTKNKPLLNSSGVLVFPSSVEVGEPHDIFKATACWIELLEDGFHWKKIGPLEIPGRKFGPIEPALFYDSQGKIRLLCRDRAHKIGEMGYLWCALSEDEGAHWSELKQTCLPNPDAGIDVIDLGQGRLVLIYNHSHTDRYPLHLAVSLDGGNSWSHPFILSENGESPYGILASDGMMHILFAKTQKSPYKRRIQHSMIDPKKLIKQAKFD